MSKGKYADARVVLHRDGWALIKNVFSLEEVEQFRKDALAYRQKGTKEDLMSDPALSRVLFDDRVLDIYKELLGDTPVYFGDSSAGVHSIDNRISHGFHKDSPDRDDPNAPDFTSPYSVLRMGIYLQDHSKHSQGLILRTGSHKVANTVEGKSVIVPNEPGDVIVWYLTTTHSGNAKRLKIFDKVVVADNGKSKLHHQLYYRMPGFMVRPEAKDRMSLFLTFGIKDHHLDRYLRYLQGRAYMLDRWRDSNWSTENLAKMDASNKMTYVNMPEQAKAHPEWSGGKNYTLDY